MNHLLVIGGAPGLDILDRDMDVVHNDALSSAAQSTSFAVARCSDPRELEAILARSREPIDQLDLYYHGAPGYMDLGRKGSTPIVLFGSTEVESSPLNGQEYVEVLDRYLNAAAQVRLLGCRTAKGPRGRLLVYKLARELGRDRVVLGTIENIIPDNFQAGVFTEPTLLFSSFEAMDGVAPTLECRCIKMPSYQSVNHHAQLRTHRKPSPKST